MYRGAQGVPLYCRQPAVYHIRLPQPTPQHLKGNNMNDWIRSIYCGGGSCVEVQQRRSSYCSGSNCVETVFDGTDVLVRDSKDPDGPVLAFTADEWEAFLEGVKAGEFAVPEKL
jgi:hypothetical protein